MATISSAGLGSGLDVESIVSKLVQIERTPIEQLQSEAKAMQSNLSAFGQVQSKISALRDAARSLGDPSSWTPTTAASSDASAVSVSAGASAIPSSYELSVSRLASAQQLASTAFAGATAAVGQGSMTIELGSWNADGSAFTPKTPASSKTITIGPGEDTLEKIRDKINGAGAGVTASIVRDASGARLTMRSSATGLENGFRVTTVDDDGDDTDAAGLSRLAYDTAAGVTSMSRNQAAANAALTINGLAISSASNTLDDVMDGLSFTLGKTTTAPVTVTVNRDNDAIKKSITDFASAYNEAITFLRAQTKYDPANKTAGTLQGDRTAVLLQQQLRNLVTGTSTGSGVLQRLSAIGLDPQSDGTLKVSASKLSSAIGQLDELKKMFTAASDTTPSANGFAVQMRKFTDAVLGDGGALDSRQSGLRDSIQRNSDRQSQLEDRISAFEKRVRAQYTALDTQMANFSGLSSYLTQQIAQFNK